MRIDFPGVVGTIEVYMDVMRAICGPTEGRSMADLMCCTAPNTPKLGFSKRTYIDIIDRKLDDPKEQQFFRHMDVFKDPQFMWGHVDVAICSDGIEHLYLEDGYKLIDLMETVSTRHLIFTPLDNIFGIDTVNGDENPEHHRSLWHPRMLPGWASIVFPDYHKVYGGGAFFSFRTPSTRYHLDKAYDELKEKSWAKV